MTSQETELIERHVEPNPHRPGVDEAWIMPWGISVWALAPYFEQPKPDIDAIAGSYDIAREAVQAALAYYRRHGSAIDACMAQNLAYLD
ncbi:MAG: hypothetical protein HW416_1224 [Chloroflexi bacterium]|nr:hypothetical protein [Chloroflexota bacterium]